MVIDFCAIEKHPFPIGQFYTLIAVPGDAASYCDVISVACCKILFDIKKGEDKMTLEEYVVEKFSMEEIKNIAKEGSRFYSVSSSEVEMLERHLQKNNITIQDIARAHKYLNNYIFSITRLIDWCMAGVITIICQNLSGLTPGEPLLNLEKMFCNLRTSMYELLAEKNEKSETETETETETERESKK